MLEGLLPHSPVTALFFFFQSSLCHQKKERGGELKKRELVEGLTRHSLLLSLAQADGEAAVYMHRQRLRKESNTMAGYSKYTECSRGAEEETKEKRGEEKRP